MDEESKLKVIDDQKTSKPWHHAGLRFKCTMCGKCCTGQPGYIWVTVDEIQEMANLLNIPKDKFIRMYIRTVNQRYSLIEKKSTPHDCMLLLDNKCLVYEKRPKQCRTFPWWKQNLESKEQWEKTAEICEGINDDAPVVALSEIEKNLL